MPTILQVLLVQRLHAWPQFILQSVDLHLAVNVRLIPAIEPVFLFHSQLCFSFADSGPETALQTPT